MAFNDRSLDDYIDVPERLADFRAKHADGSLQRDGAYEIVRVPNGWCVKCKGNQFVSAGKQNGKQQWKKCPRCDGSGVRREDEPREDVFIVYTAVAYRTAEDSKPGMGTAWEPYPGQTPYTSGSEMMNAETSAWGRAIVAALAADAKRGVSSREEVRNRAAEQDDDWRNQPPVQGHNGHPVQDTPDVSQWEDVQPATDDKWLAEIKTEIDGLKTKDYAQVLWRRVHEKTEAGGCTPRDGKMLQESITERINAITKQPAEAAT